MRFFSIVAASVLLVLAYTAAADRYVVGPNPGALVPSPYTVFATFQLALDAANANTGVADTIYINQTSNTVTASPAVNVESLEIMPVPGFASTITVARNAGSGEVLRNTSGAGDLYIHGTTAAPIKLQQGISTTSVVLTTGPTKTSTLSITLENVILDRTNTTSTNGGWLELDNNADSHILTDVKFTGGDASMSSSIMILGSRDTTTSPAPTNVPITLTRVDTSAASTTGKRIEMGYALLTATNCNLQSPTGVASTMFTLATTPRVVTGQTATFDDCTLRSNGASLVTGIIAPMEITVRRPTFTGSCGGIVFNMTGNSGSRLTISGSDNDGSPRAGGVKTNIDAAMGAGSILLVRCGGGTFNFTDLTGSVANANTSSGVFDAGAAISNDITVNMARCEWIGAIGKTRHRGTTSSGTYKFTLNASNCLWRGGDSTVPYYIDLATQTYATPAPGEVNLNHCTLTGGPLNALINVRSADSISAAGSILDSSSVIGSTLPTANVAITALNTVPNIFFRSVGDAGTTGADPTPAPIKLNPVLSATGRLLAGSPALEAATGSLLIYDVDGESRPNAVGSTPDIGADEAPDLTPPAVSIGTPTTVVMNVAGNAVFPVTVSGSTSVNLLSSHVTINHSGTSGGTVTILNATTATPSVRVTGVLGDGSITISLAAAFASDLAGNLSEAVGPSAASVNVDNTRPEVTIDSPVGSPIRNGGPAASYGVIVTGADTINLVSGNVSLTRVGTFGGSVSIGDGNTANPFVDIKNLTGDGTVAITIAAGIATDLAGNASLAVGPSEVVVVDNTRPTVSIGLPVGSPVNSSGTVTYPVTIGNADIVNLLPGNVTMARTGVGVATITVIDGNTSTPSIELSNVSGNGTYTISIAANIASDLAGNTSLAAGPSLQAIVDNTPPTIALGAPSTTLTNAGPVSYTVTYGSASTITLSPADITLLGTVTGTVDVTGTDPNERTVTVSGIAGDGTLRISIAAGTAADGAGNLAASAGPSAITNVDNTAPTVTLSGPSVPVTSGGPVTYTASYSDGTGSGLAGITLTGSDITLTGSGATATVAVSGAGNSRTITLSGIAGDGTLGVQIAAGTATDLVGNVADASAASTEFTVDNTAPVLSDVRANPNSAIVDEVSTITFVSNELLQTSPVLTVNGNDATYVSVGPDTGGYLYTFAYTVQADDPFAPTEIIASGADAAGNLGGVQSNNALTVRDPHPLPVAAWPVVFGLALVGAAAARRKQRG